MVKWHGFIRVILKCDILSNHYVVLTSHQDSCVHSPFNYVNSYSQEANVNVYPHLIRGISSSLLFFSYKVSEYIERNTNGLHSSLLVFITECHDFICNTIKMSIFLPTISVALSSHQNSCANSIHIIQALFTRINHKHSLASQSN